MTHFDWNDFQERLARRRKERAAEEAAEVRRLVQAAPRADLLTASEEWNYALSVMENEVQSCEKRMATARDYLESAALPTAERDVVIGQLLQLRARVDTIREIMQLPVKMKEMGKEAKERLDGDAQADAG